MDRTRYSAEYITYSSIPTRDVHVRVEMSNRVGVGRQARNALVQRLQSRKSVHCSMSKSELQYTKNAQDWSYKPQS